MNKNGFTLIELLAVIVILAIIALIASPIILGIIQDTKEESNKRSVDLYADTIKKTIATKELKDLKGIVPGSYNTEELKTKLNLNVEYEGNKVECDTIELYRDGRIYITNCKINNEPIDYTYGVQQEILAQFNDVCTPVSQATLGNIPTGEYNPGDEYMCEVKPGESYRFYVLSKEEKRINLILESNIRRDGTLIKESLTIPENQKEYEGILVQWSYNNIFLELGGTEEEWKNNIRTHRFGPIAPTAFLKDATSSWTNLGSLIVKEYEYCDETYTVEGCTMRDMAKTYISNARLPYFTENQLVGCGLEGDTGQDGYDSCPEWMLSYMDYEEENTTYTKTTEIDNVKCYWHASSILESSAWTLSSQPNDEAYCAARPVISLEI